MPTIEVKIVNLEEIKKALANFPQVAEKNLQLAVEASVAEIEKAAVRPTVPFKTGALIQSFSFGRVIGRLIGKSGPTVNYAIYVHEGTRPHIILPKNGKALYWKGAAHPVKSVKHPGTKPNRFMDAIAQKVSPRIQALFQRAIEKIIEETTKY